jgi:hypothetical protein
LKVSAIEDIQGKLGQSVNILFVMERRINAGSIQALANYVRAGKRLAHHIALYGASDPAFPEIPCSTELDAFDHIIFIFESKLSAFTGLQLARLLTLVPRSRRVILDADGMYNPRIIIDNYDRNHNTERDCNQWAASYEAVSDRIVQPSLSPCQPRVEPFLFYGYDSKACIQSGGAKHFDVMHLAHNWWRWREVSERLLPAIEDVRNDLKEICFVGMWWDTPPSWAAAIGQQDAFYVDRGRLHAARIRVLPPVPYGEVIATMSTARINIMTQRPLLRRLRLVTSKYFEVFTADTIALVMLDVEHAAQLYGPAGRELVLDNEIADKLIDVLKRPKRYQDLVQDVRQHLTTHHSYERRLQDLVALLVNGPQRKAS